MGIADIVFITISVLVGFIIVAAIDRAEKINYEKKMHIAMLEKYKELSEKYEMALAELKEAENDNTSVAAFKIKEKEFTKTKEELCKIILVVEEIVKKYDQILAVEF